MIRDALTQLMEEKGFDAISVRDLTEKADRNRGTFYLHYRDKYDLLVQSEEELHLPVEIFIAYITSAILGVMQQWLNSGMQQSPHEISLMLFKMNAQGPMVAIGLESARE